MRWLLENRSIELKVSNLQIFPFSEDVSFEPGEETPDGWLNRVIDSQTGRWIEYLVREGWMYSWFQKELKITVDSWTSKLNDFQIKIEHSFGSTACSFEEIPLVYID